MIVKKREIQRARSLDNTEELAALPVGVGVMMITVVEELVTTPWLFVGEEEGIEC